MQRACVYLGHGSATWRKVTLPSVSMPMFLRRRFHLGKISFPDSFLCASSGVTKYHDGSYLQVLCIFYLWKCVVLFFFLGGWLFKEQKRVKLFLNG